MGKVLLIEDQEADAEVIRLALEGQKIDVVHVVDLESAAEALPSTRWAGVLLDLHIGGQISGLAAVGHVVALVPHLPVIVVTGLSAAEYAIEVHRAGALGWVVKPEASGAAAVAEFGELLAGHVRRMHAYKSSRPEAVAAALGLNRAAQDATALALAELADQVAGFGDALDRRGGDGLALSADLESSGALPMPPPTGAWSSAVAWALSPGGKATIGGILALLTALGVALGFVEPTDPVAVDGAAE